MHICIFIAYNYSGFIVKLFKFNCFSIIYQLFYRLYFLLMLELFIFLQCHFFNSKL